MAVGQLTFGEMARNPFLAPPKLLIRPKLFFLEISCQESDEMFCRQFLTRWLRTEGWRLMEVERAEIFRARAFWVEPGLFSRLFFSFHVCLSLFKAELLPTVSHIYWKPIFGPRAFELKQRLTSPLVALTRTEKRNGINANYSIESGQT